MLILVGIIPLIAIFVIHEEKICFEAFAKQSLLEIFWTCSAGGPLHNSVPCHVAITRLI